MIFELPIEHFPASRTVSPSAISRTEGSRTTLGFKLPFSSASCLEISRAVNEEPTVTRATFNFGKSASTHSLATMDRPPRLSLSVPPVGRVSLTPEPTRRPSLCARIVSTLSIPTVTA